MFLVNLRVIQVTEVELKWNLMALYIKKTKVPTVRCTGDVDRTCKGRVIMQSNNPVKKTSHTLHGPSKFEAEEQKSMARLEEAASLVKFSTSKRSVDEMVSRRNG